MSRACPFGDNPRLVGDPVDTLTGAVIERQHDFKLAGPLPLRWWRHYDSSKVSRRYALGWGQTHDFDCSLRFDQDGMQFVGPLGAVTYFAPLLADGQCEHSQGRSLHRISSLRYRLSEHAAPDREFDFEDPQIPARLARLIHGEHSIEFQYDIHGWLEGIIDSLGNRIQVLTIEDGLVVSLFFPKTKERDRRDLLRYEYDRRGCLIAGADGFGSQFTMEYDAAGRLVRKVDRIGHAFEFDYDAQGRCIRTAGSDGLLDHRLEYGRDHQETKVTRGNGGVWRYRYTLGRLTNILDPLGGNQQFLYDDQGRMSGEIDPNGNLSTLLFDGSGATIGKHDALGHFYSIPVDPNAPHPLHHRVAQNSLEYELGRLVSLESLQADRTEASKESNLHEINRPPQTQLEKANLYSTQNLGIVVGRNWWPAPETGRQFDATGDLVHQVDAKGRTRRWMYDGNGNVTKYVDFDGGVWRYEYKSWNHLIRETNPLGLSNQMEYDSQENLTSFTDGGGTRSEYEYDLKDALIEVRRHGQRRESYVRDAAGNLLKKFGADGRLLMELEYGPGNLVTKRSLASGDELTYAYDPRGRYLLANTKQDMIEYQYDVFGNRSLEMRNGRGVLHRFRGWRKFGESVWLDRFLIRYQEERDGTLNISDPTGGIQRIRLLSDGRVEKRFSNGTVETARYDHVGRCQSKCVERMGSQRWSREYQWSGEGELRTVNDSIRGITIHGYDAAHRLVSRSLASGIHEEFQWDAANNLLKQPGLDRAVVKTGNRIQTANGEEFEYNDRNHICRRAGNTGTTKYEYDSRDQLVRVESERGIWTAEFDAMGRRVRKTFNGATTEYLWNTDQLAGEIDPTGRFRLYIYADPLALTPMMFVEYESIDAEPDLGRRFFVLCDQIGTPICVEDGAGNVVWEANIDPFCRANFPGKNQIDFNFRFAGHYWDEDIALNYNHFRFYDPVLGRYIQSDPLGIVGGSNLYSYPCNPVNDVDTRGLSSNGGCCSKSASPVPGCAPDCEYNPSLGPLPSGARVIDNSSPTHVIYEMPNGERRIRFNAESAVTLKAANPGRNMTVDNLASVNDAGLPYVHEGRHRAIGAAQGQAIPANLGGVPGSPGVLDYEYSSSTPSGGLPVKNLSIDNSMPDMDRDAAIANFPDRN